MKLNNRGFAITSVLYGLLILFVLLTGSYLTLLGTKKSRLDTIASDIENKYDFNITLPINQTITYPYKAPYTGKYTFNNNCIQYLYNNKEYNTGEINCTGNLIEIRCHGSEGGNTCE